MTRLTLVVRCGEPYAQRARYALDTLLLAAGVPVVHARVPATDGPSLVYSEAMPEDAVEGHTLFVPCSVAAWQAMAAGRPDAAPSIAGLPVPFAQCLDRGTSPAPSLAFDLVANAFYFLSSWAERHAGTGDTRHLYATSEYARLGIPLDIVDRYLARLQDALEAIGVRRSRSPWPQGREYALVLSHDVDYLAVHPWDNLVQAGKAVARHLVRQRDPGDAWRAGLGYLRAVAQRRDAYSGITEILAGERAMGVKSSFQVAVGHRHPNDVNYRVEDDGVRDDLRAILDAGFELNLHGSYRSTENVQWYVDEVELLTRRLGRPLGSRQHFLSFDYDRLFEAQERAGIEYDMSIGYPDRTGARAGFSFPYFPYNLREERPYRVLQIPLMLMDVTLRGYMGLRPEPARAVIDAQLDGLRAKGGAASAVWHPIVFGGARDPGYDRLYFEMVRRVAATGGWATDGRSVNAHWRTRAAESTSLPRTLSATHAS
jgi:hypothetical protein